MKKIIAVTIILGFIFTLLAGMAYTLDGGWAASFQIAFSAVGIALLLFWAVKELSR